MLSVSAQHHVSVAGNPVCDPQSYTETDLRSPVDLRTRIITGRREILAMHPLLLALSIRYGQIGAMDHLEYFLCSATAQKKTPHLVLLGPDMHRPGVGEENVIAAMLIYEYRLLGCRSGMFATDDMSGRRTLIAPEALRPRALDLACTAIMRKGGQIIVMSVAEDAGSMLSSTVSPIRVRGAWSYSSRDREVPSYLQLESTVDATLAKMGQKTRSNLRYYRRRAEAQLGSSFVQSVNIHRYAFKAFNRECMYAVSDQEAGLRFDSLTKVPGMFLCGLKDRDGRWLSMIGGRRYHGMVEIDWQMNRDGMHAASLSTVMRAYFIEDEVARGTNRMYIEGGTPHTMRFSFTTDLVRDVVIVKHARLAAMMRRMALRLLPEKNFVRGILGDQTLTWAKLH
jgi:hypothetical protein